LYYENMMEDDDFDDDDDSFHMEDFDETDVGSLEEMYAEFDKLIEGTVVTYSTGDTCNGTILDTDRRGASVDVGGKAAARVDMKELSTCPISDVRPSSCSFGRFSRAVSVSTL
jgi:hypothetical protein